jgi:hypothetical protein
MNNATAGPKQSASSASRHFERAKFSDMGIDRDFIQRHGRIKRKRKEAQ